MFKPRTSCEWCRHSDTTSWSWCCKGVSWTGWHESLERKGVAVTTLLFTMAKQLKPSAFLGDLCPSLSTLFHELGLPGAVVTPRLSCRAQVGGRSKSLFCPAVKCDKFWCSHALCCSVSKVCLFIIENNKNNLLSWQYMNSSLIVPFQVF